MDIKLTLLFLIITAIIILSYFNDENIERIKKQMPRLQWRTFKPPRIKI
jgi:hypothetical protein